MTFEEPLFLVSEICKILEINDKNKFVKNLDAEDVFLLNSDDLKLSTANYQSINLRPNIFYNFLNEDGVYESIMMSKKPIAKQFKKFIKTLLHNLRTNKLKLIEEKNNKLEYDNECLKKENKKLKYHDYTIFKITNIQNNNQFISYTRRNIEQQAKDIFKKSRKSLL